MDFTQIIAPLRENKRDAVAIHRLIKEAVGAKVVDILFYDEKENIFFDKVSKITIHASFLDESSLLGYILTEKRAYFTTNILGEKRYNFAIDNPFKIEMKNQIIIPILRNKTIKGIIRFSQLPMGFSYEDYRHLAVVLPIFEEIFFDTIHSIYDTVPQKVERVKIFNIVNQMRRLFETLLENITDPEVEKLIAAGEENIETILTYLNPNTTNVANIKKELQQLNQQKNRLCLNVLIADDVRINVQILNAILSEEESVDKIFFAYDGIEAIKVIENAYNNNHRIGIFFLDHHMPGLTGTQIAEKLKGKHYFEDKISIVSITNDPEAIAKKNYLYDYHISKPFKKEKVKEIIHKIKIDHFSVEEEKKKVC